MWAAARGTFVRRFGTAVTTLRLIDFGEDFGGCRRTLDC